MNIIPSELMNESSHPSDSIRADFRTSKQVIRSDSYWPRKHERKS